MHALQGIFFFWFENCIQSYPTNLQYKKNNSSPLLNDIILQETSGSEGGNAVTFHNFIKWPTAVSVNLSIEMMKSWENAENGHFPKSSS